MKKIILNLMNAGGYVGVFCLSTAGFIMQVSGPSLLSAILVSLNIGLGFGNLFNALKK